MKTHISTLNIFATTVILIASSWVNADRVQTGYPPSKTIESVTFSVTAIEKQEGRKIKLIGECDACPENLYLANTSSIEFPDGSYKTGDELKNIGLYEAIFIGFDSNYVINSILLR